MRTLSVKRTKSFIGCTGKVKIYVEDAAGDITINGFGCRLLGVLKNGETGQYLIGDEAVKIFAIYDKVSKDYCFDCYELAAGTEDVELSGKPKYNPTAGNPFRFANNTSEMAKVAKKKSKNGIIVTIAAMIVGFAVGFVAVSAILGHKKTASKDFTCGEMTITLNNSFGEKSYVGFNTVYQSQDMMVFVLNEAMGQNAEFADLSVDEYAEAVVLNNTFESDINHKDGLTYFNYDLIPEGQTERYYYYGFVFKSDENFWLIQFTVMDNSLKDKIFGYAKTVRFN